MPVPDASPLLEKRLMREDVYAQLREWIIDGTLIPAEKLRDIELAERLGVSRTPVREALRQLEDEGLVETKQNAWTRVASVDASLAARIYPILRVLEPLALELSFPSFTARDIQKMRQLNARVQTALKRGDARAAALEDTALHGTWTAACGNPELCAIIRDLKTQHIRLEIAYWGGEAALESVEEHARLIAALEARDLKSAKRALESNWTRALARFQSLHTPDFATAQPSAAQTKENE
jgi:DNA-binding GntR family transcriptional regulator